MNIKSLGAIVYLLTEIKSSERMVLADSLSVVMLCNVTMENKFKK
jgi:hypothetical protein